MVFGIGYDTTLTLLPSLLTNATNHTENRRDLTMLIAYQQDKLIGVVLDSTSSMALPQRCDVISSAVELAWISVKFGVWLERFREEKEICIYCTILHWKTFCTIRPLALTGEVMF